MTISSPLLYGHNIRWSGPIEHGSEHVMGGIRLKVWRRGRDVDEGESWLVLAGFSEMSVSSPS